MRVSTSCKYAHGSIWLRPARSHEGGQHRRGPAPAVASEDRPVAAGRRQNSRTDTPLGAASRIADCQNRAFSTSCFFRLTQDLSALARLQNTSSAHVATWEYAAECRRCGGGFAGRTRCISRRSRGSRWTSKTAVADAMPMGSGREASRRMARFFFVGGLQRRWAPGRRFPRRSQSASASTRTAPG